MPASTLDQIMACLHAHRFRYANEGELADSIECALTTAGLDVAREVELGGRSGRIDFLVDRVGIEVKVAGTFAAVARQLSRYALSGQVDVLLLVTNRTAHFAVAGVTLGGIPVHVYAVVGWL